MKLKKVNSSENYYYDPYFLYLRSLIDFAYQLVDTTKGSAFMRTKYVGREMVAEMRIPGMKQPVLISMYDERFLEETWKLLVAKANGNQILVENDSLNQKKSSMIERKNT